MEGRNDFALTMSGDEHCCAHFILLDSCFFDAFQGFIGSGLADSSYGSMPIQNLAPPKSFTMNDPNVAFPSIGKCLAAAAEFGPENRPLRPKNNPCQGLMRSLKTLPFIPKIRGRTRFVWSLTPWSQEVLNVMA